jgi:hypothetical protein
LTPRARCLTICDTPAGIITLLVQFGAGLGLGGLAGGPFGGVVGAVAGLIAGGGYGWAIASARVYRGVRAGATSAIQRHEDTHVLQARLFGPLYVPLIAAHYALATLLPYWLAYHDRAERPIDSVATYFRRGVYPHVWHEEWAYRVQGQPPL